MKTLVVYYSRSGHTRQVANEIAAHCGADLEVIREANSRDGLVGYFHSGWQALIGAAPPVCPTIIDPANYDLVILGTPIWNFSLAPPVRSYAQRYGAHFKQVAFFCTEGGAGDQRAFSELARICAREPITTLTVTEKQLPEPAHKEPLRSFVARLAVG